MALFFRINDPDQAIHFGEKADMCYLCLKKESEGKSNMIDAKRKLAGRLENKKIVKIRYRGSDMVLCKECVKELVTELGGDEE